MNKDNFQFTGIATNASGEHSPKEVESQPANKVPLTYKEGDKLVEERFEVIEEIGEGRFSKVYRCRDTFADSREVAIKTLTLQQNKTAYKQLLQENTAQDNIEGSKYIARATLHKHVVSGVDLPVLEMPLARLTLRHWLNQHENDKSARQNTGLVLFKQICEGVKAIHSAKILHLDLKPENILLFCADKENHLRAAISDFGMARSILRSTAQESNDLHSAYGTAAYMAPEQWNPRRPEDVSCQADIYALGTMLFEILDGKRPFAHGDPTALMNLKTNNPITRDDAEQSLSNIPQCYHEVIITAMSPKPQRYQNIEALMDALNTASQPEDKAGIQEILQREYRGLQELKREVDWIRYLEIKGGNCIFLTIWLDKSRNLSYSLVLESENQNIIAKWSPNNEEPPFECDISNYDNTAEWLKTNMKNGGYDV